MLLSFNRKLHRELKRQAPDGYEVFTVKCKGTLFIMIYCDDANYFAPWTGVQSIMERFGY